MDILASVTGNNWLVTVSDKSILTLYKRYILGTLLDNVYIHVLLSCDIMSTVLYVVDSNNSWLRLM